MGCAPYLQIFKAGKLIHTSAASLHVQQSDEELPFVQVMDGTVPFNINQIIQGDILIRCRHLTFEKKRVSMFRAAFHTGYAPPNVLRLTKTELDGACADKRYPDDFFLDLIFEKVDADALARHDEENESGEEESKSGGDGDAGDGTDEKRKGPVLKASNFDSMLQGDSRFWGVIASKKKEHAKQSNADPFYGPTVGRRRGDSAKKETEEKHKNMPGTLKICLFHVILCLQKFDICPHVNKLQQPFFVHPLIFIITNPKTKHLNDGKPQPSKQTYKTNNILMDFLTETKSCKFLDYPLD